MPKCKTIYKRLIRAGFRDDDGCWHSALYKIIKAKPRKPKAKKVKSVEAWGIQNASGTIAPISFRHYAEAFKAGIAGQHIVPVKITLRTIGRKK